MLDETFEKFEETFATFSREMKQLFGNKTDFAATKVGGVTVAVCDGDVNISGPLKKLRINGRLVRFKE